MKLVNTVISILVLFFFSNQLLAQSDFQKLPAKFEANQIFIETVTEDQDTIKFLTDTGGGSIVIRKKKTNELGWSTDITEWRGRTLQISPLPNLDPEYHIPFMPQKFSAEEESFLNEKKEIFSDKILVMPQQPGVYEELDEEGLMDDGVLGQDWFATRIWTFDYKKEELLLHNSYDLENKSNKHVIPMSFQTDDDGRHTHHMPRIQAEIDGEKLDFLFDTGATTFMSDSALAQLNDGLTSTRGASFITKFQFEKWKSDNPEWKVIEKGEKFIGGDYIEVPEVTIAGHTVGPVWFTTRPDQNFHQYMAAMMDKKVEGALGGALFQYIRITVNYPEEYAVFEKAK